MAQTAALPRPIRPYSPRMAEPSESLDPVHAPAATEPQSADDVERAQALEWLKNVYQGDRMPQLTLRAVLTGMVLGGVMAISNLYVGMKTGWGLGVTITACILAYAMFSGLQRIVPGLKKN